MRKRPTTTRAGKAPRTPSAAREVRALRSRVTRLEGEIARAAARHAQQIERVRRAADRRLAIMMREIAALRHHQARAEALARLLEAHGMAATTRGTGDGENPGLSG